MPQTETVPELQEVRRIQREDSVPLVILSLIAVAYCIWILFLPLFPTQDGPMHLYYARIMQALLFHRDPGIFPQYFLIKHVLPPYSLYYYLLLLLSSFVSMAAADKLVICLYVVLFLYGFRYLGRAIGPSGDSMALLATPLVLNWPLCMGFVNFCLSTALSLWALGLWCRVARQPGDRRNARRLAAYLVLCVVIMLTHPVPLLGILGFCLVEFAVRLVRLRRDDQSNSEPHTYDRARPYLFRDGMVLACAYCTLIYVKAFTTNNIARQIDPAHSGYINHIISNAHGLFLLHTYNIFAGKGAWDVVYRVSIIAILIIPLMLAVKGVVHSLRLKTWSLANTWLVLCTLLAVALPIIPPDVNNSHFFAARLVIFVWIAALIAGSGTQSSWLRPRSASTAAACIFAASVTAVILLLAAHRITPIAQQIARIERTPQAGQNGVWLMLQAADYESPHTITFDPYRWSGVGILRRQNAVLYNTPWLDLAIIPVGAKPVMPTGKIDLVLLEYEFGLRTMMLESADTRALVFPQVNMVLINHGIRRAGVSVDPLLAIDPVPGHEWSCAPVVVYSVCTAREMRGTHPPQ